MASPVPGYDDPVFSSRSFISRSRLGRIQGHARIVQDRWIVMGAGVVALLSALLSHEALLSWGWR
ncbi:hypothetical protein PPH41_42565, partial [Burkholderia gladioli]|nr:hypothetical protein [Burkholderia gladioli]